MGSSVYERLHGIYCTTDPSCFGRLINIFILYLYLQEHFDLQDLFQIKMFLYPITFKKYDYF